MPLILAPYTLGSFQGAAGPAAVGGAAYYTRRRRYMEYLLASLALLLVASCW
jgi:hypothetical protein